MIKVPYLGLARYDRGGFDGFLDRIGAREEDIVDFRRDNASQDWKLSCLQGWLFFGSMAVLWLAPRGFQIVERSSRA